MAKVGGVRVATVPAVHTNGLPPEFLDKLVAALQYTVKDADVKQRFADLGATTMPPEKATPAALQAHLKAEIDRWGPLIKKAGVYAD